jgi:CRISPR-associated protein Cas1
MSESGRFRARIQGPVSGNVLLRREQYRRADDEAECVTIAKSILIAKTANNRTVLKRAVRDHGDTVAAMELNSAADIMSRIAGDLERSAGIASLRGFEGDAARAYFRVFDHLIVAQKVDFFFHERTRRPPLDPMNSLLSFYYTLLAHDVASALETVGLDPAVGFLHKERPGRPSLALDLMEELRPLLADRAALSLVNRQQVTGKGFRKTETGAILMTDETRKTVLKEYQKRKQEGLRHPFLNEKMPVGLIAHAQALLFARYLRGDLDGYPPFLWR